MWQLAIETEKLFDATVADMRVSLDYLLDGIDSLPTIFYYVEKMRISLWDTAFFREFGVEKGNHKNHNIDKQVNFNRPCEGYFIDILNMPCSLLKPFLNFPFFLLTIWISKVKNACSQKGS